MPPTDEHVFDPTFISGVSRDPASEPRASAPRNAVSVLGRQAGSFKLVRELGRGGMGTVYLGEHELIGSRVAVKVLHPHLSGDPTVVQRFFAEARAVNLIGHENIVRIFDMNRMPSGEWFLVMEYLAGQPLSGFGQKSFAEKTTSQILAQVCDALDAAHARGVVHRDVKPDNIFVLPRADGSFFVKLLDFGIARFFGDLKSMSQTSGGMLVGTPAFMSPEQWDGGAIDARTDVFAVGVLGWLLATGKNPFANLPLTDIVVSQRKQAYSSEGAALSPKFREVLLRAMAPRPDDRFRSAAELRDVIRKLADSRVVTTPGTPPPSALPLRTHELDRFPVTLEEGGSVKTLECVDLSRAGMFVCTEGTMPPLRATLSFLLKLPGGHLACRGEVVRHVPPSLARQWSMPPGFAVQFVETSRSFAERVDRLTRGKFEAVPTPAATAAPKEDPYVTQRLRDLACRLTGDPYALLGAAPDAPFPEIRRKARALLDELHQLSRLPLSSDSRDRLKRLLEQAQAASWTLGEPPRRAEHDAARGNFRGVARSLAAGLSVSEADKLRTAWVSDHPRHPSRAQLHRISGDVHASRSELASACAEYEKALALDPLNVELHRAFWTLQRRMTSGERAV